MIIALSLLVGLPMVGLTFLALKVASDEREMAAVQWRQLLEGRLRDLANGIAAQTEAIERETLKTLETTATDADQLRQMVRTRPLVSQAFLLDGAGKLQFPAEDRTASVSEREFLARTRAIWNGSAILYAPPRAEVASSGGERSVVKSSTAKKRAPRPNEAPAVQQVMQSPSSATRGNGFQGRSVPPFGGLGSASGSAGGRDRRGDSLLDLAERRDFGWLTWYWQEGLHLLLWRRQAARETKGALGPGVVGVEIDRIAAVGRILGQLPEPANVDGRIQLLNGRGEVVAQWGLFDPPEDAVAAAQVPLSPPWSAWRLLYFPSPSQQAGFLAGSYGWSLGLGLTTLMLSLLGLAIYFYRESDREMRDASQRVTFVTQVSHELKTPLTNIRLYAELLDRDLEDTEADDGTRHRLAIIVSEAQRLSRLISNILTFSRQRRGRLTVSPQRVALDPMVRGMIEQFRPALAASGIEVELELDAPEPTFADPDTVDQIIANLLSNVEKYAAAGAWVRVSSMQTAEATMITVADRGPGIAPEHRDRIFQPFYRISDRLSDGVTGTGIGLALSAELARKNRGTLILVPADHGACFELRLPRAQDGG